MRSNLITTPVSTSKTEGRMHSKFGFHGA